MATPGRESRTHQRAAKLRHPSSSVAPVAFGYERALRPSLACLSRLVSTITTDGDR
jgi:hypothetical protein